jgi:adenylate cyclase
MLSSINDTTMGKLTLVIPDEQGHTTALVLLPENTPFHIGRNGENCQLMINAEFVSRDHCHIDYQHGNFLLRDHSSNGIHLVKAGEQPIYLRRNSIPLFGEGSIGIGRLPEGAAAHVIGFRC